MSYILDALKKADRDRRLRRAPSLGTIHTAAEPTRRRLWPWLVGGVVGANVVALGLFFGMARDDGTPADAQRAAATTATANAPTLGPAAPGTVAANPASASAAGSGSAHPGAPATASGPAHQAASTPTTEHAAPALVAESSAGVRRTASEPDASRGRDATTRDRATDDRGPGVAANPRPQHARSAPGRTTTAARDEAPGDRGAPVPATRSGALESGAPRVAGRDGSAARAADTDKSAAQLKLEVLVYADEPAERSAWINGQRYVEGQRVQGRLVVEKIAPDAVVLGGDGQRVVLRQ